MACPLRVIISAGVLLLVVLFTFNINNNSHCSRKLNSNSEKQETWSRQVEIYQCVVQKCKDLYKQLYRLSLIKPVKYTALMILFLLHFEMFSNGAMCKYLFVG